MVGRRDHRARGHSGPIPATRYILVARSYARDGGGPALGTTNSWLVPRTGRAAAEHVRLRFDIWPIGVGDHVRLERGRLTAMGYATPTFTEIIFVLPNGEPEQDPKSPEMAKAWTAYWSSERG